MSRIKPIFLTAAIAALTLCAAPPPAVQKPKLVLAIVVDQFRYDYTLRFRDDYHGGLAKLLDHGAVFTDAHHRHSTTVTAIGHSTFLSGAPPSASGIVGNDWFDRETGKTVTSVSDPKTKLIGGPPGQTGSSPNRLEVSTVGDELKIAHADTHIIGVSIKDRAAILPSGHMADGAYWYDSASNNWVTSSFYTSALPAWVEAVNAKHTAQHLGNASWLPVDAKPGAAKPFCSMAKDADVPRCGELEATPWGNEMIEDFAERALDGEKLGRHAGVDVLTVSFSSNDYVGHAVGPDDPEVRDMAIRVDRLIGKLVDYVDQRVGAGNTLIVMTADHGVAPVPEVNQKRNMPGGRLSAPQLRKSMTDALVKRYGAGDWFIGGSATMPYLNWELIRAKKLDLAEVESVAAEAARHEPHIARVYTWLQLLEGNVQRDPIGDAMSLSFFAPRSGDLLIVPDPYYLFESSGTSHGTPYDYDTHVPLIFYGPGIKPGTYSTRVGVNDVAPTLSEILHVEKPSGSIGRVLSEILTH